MTLLLKLVKWSGKKVCFAFLKKYVDKEIERTKSLQYATTVVTSTSSYNTPKLYT